MPYYVENDPPLLQLAGLASAYFKVSNELKQTKLAQQQQEESAKYTAQEIAASKTQQATERQAAGFQPGTDTPGAAPQYAPMPQPEKGKGTNYLALADWAAKNAQVAYQNHDASGLSFWQNQQKEYIGEYSAQSLGGYRGEEGQLAKAKVGLTEAQTKNAINKFPHDIEMLKARGVQAESVARIRAAYRSHGGGRASNTAAQEQRAEYAALNAASREGTNAYNAMENSVYRYGLMLHEENPDQYPNEPPPPQLQNYQIYLPTPGQPSTPIIFQMTPQGQLVKPQSGQTPAKPQNRRPAASAPSAPSSGGGMLQNIGNWIHEHFGGGGGGSAQHLTAKTKSGQAIHSDDGGKTWQPGP